MSKNNKKYIYSALMLTVILSVFFSLISCGGGDSAVITNPVTNQREGSLKINVIWPEITDSNLTAQVVHPYVDNINIKIDGGVQEKDIAPPANEVLFTNLSPGSVNVEVTATNSAGSSGVILAHREQPETIVSYETTEATVHLGISILTGGTLQPETIPVSRIDTIYWRNNDTVNRTVDFDNPAIADITDLLPGSSDSRTFSTPGNYTYTCNGNNGTVIVGEGPVGGTNYTFINKWGWNYPQDSGPYGIAVDISSGCIYAGFFKSIIKLDLSYNYLETIATGGGAPGEVFNAQGLGTNFSPPTFLYVADASNNRIQKYDGSSWTIFKSGFGSLDGQFNEPYDVAVDNAGLVYVADKENNRIQRFAPAGNWMDTWGGFSGPEGIAVDMAGSVYVADTGNNRICKFDGSVWTDFVAPGLLISPRAVTVDKFTGDVYVGDLMDRVLKFNSAGVYQIGWGSSGDNPGEFDGVRDMDMLLDFSIYVADINGSIQNFDSGGVYQSSWRWEYYGDGGFARPTGIAMDSYNNIYVADTCRIQRFDFMGNFIDKFGKHGNEDSELRGSYDLTFDTSGNMYITCGNNTVKKFDSARVYQDQWISAPPVYNFGSAFGVTSDSLDNIYFADISRHCVFKFDGSDWSVFAGTYNTSGSGNGEFFQPADVAADSSDNIYVTDLLNNRVQKFASDGTYIAQWASASPVSIATDSSDYVYVSDTLNMFIYKYDASGNLQTQFGGPGSGDGQFSLGMAGGIEVDSLGNVYVVDTDNQRIQVFASEP